MVLLAGRGRLEAQADLHLGLERLPNCNEDGRIVQSVFTRCLLDADEGGLFRTAPDGHAFENLVVGVDFKLGLALELQFRCCKTVVDQVHIWISLYLHGFDVVFTVEDLEKATLF